jgi:hypothetical protein
VEQEHATITTDSYALMLANESYEWYKTHAIRSRKSFTLLETSILLLGAAIPTSAALAQDSTTVPAILGAGVVILSGLRGIFHWQDNYIRFSRAREAVEAERPPVHDRITAV